MRLIPMLAAAAAFGLAAPVSAAGFANPDEIDRAVAEFTGVPTGSQGGARLPVDRRLKLSQCSAPLALEWYGRTRDTVLVRCPVSGGWRIFVPVEAGPPAARAEKVVARGEVVTMAVRGNGFTLSRQGEALDSGAVGEWIRVRPAGAARQETVRVRVLQPGRVGMELP